MVMFLSSLKFSFVIGVGEKFPRTFVSRSFSILFFISLLYFLFLLFAVYGWRSMRSVFSNFGLQVLYTSLLPNMLDWGSKNCLSSIQVKICYALTYPPFCVWLETSSRGITFRSSRHGLLSLSFSRRHWLQFRLSLILNNYVKIKF